MVDPNCGTVKGYWRYVQLSTSELFDDQLKYRFASSKEKEKQGIFSVVVDIRGLEGDSLKILSQPLCYRRFFSASLRVSLSLSFQ